MKAFKTVITTICFLFFTIYYTAAQSVGINSNGTAPDASALLDLSAKDKGFLITRVDTANIVSPAFGLMTLSPKDSCLYLYNGKGWIGMGGGGNNCNCGEPISGGTPPQSNCGDPFTDVRDGKIYGSVQIGNQCWMKENLNFTPSHGKHWCYENVSSNCDTYGILYNWEAAMNGEGSSGNNPSGVQGICPSGWHLPSDLQWQELEVFLGMPPATASTSGWRGSNEGSAMKTSSWGGNNSSGFTALPGGHRAITGIFYAEGRDAYWWSTTEESTTRAWYRIVVSIRGDLARAPWDKNDAFSVRCIRN